MAHSHRARRNGDEAETTEPKTEAQTTTMTMTRVYDSPGDDAPATRHIQPSPINVLVMHGQGTTTISRLWANGEGARCRLCPRERCSLTAFGMCLVKLGRHVPDEDTRLAPWDAPSTGVGAVRLAPGAGLADDGE